jgi:hypothetical protein
VSRALSSVPSSNAIDVACSCIVPPNLSLKRTARRRRWRAVRSRPVSLVRWASGVSSYSFDEVYVAIMGRDDAIH